MQNKPLRELKSMQIENLELKDLAKDFIFDPDAKEGKVFKYFT